MDTIRAVCTFTHKKWKFQHQILQEDSLSGTTTIIMGGTQGSLSIDNGGRDVMLVVNLSCSISQSAFTDPQEPFFGMGMCQGGAQGSVPPTMMGMQST